MNDFSISKIPHIDEVSGIHGKFVSGTIKKNFNILEQRERMQSKVVESLEQTINLCELKDGMTISFHHHFRNGDYIVNKVIDKLAEMGFKNLTLAASSLTNIHYPLINHIKNGVIKRIETSGLRGQLAGEISRGLMDYPVVFRSHGGRAYAIESGELHIDVAFLGAPSCDPFGNANGYARENDNGVICGSMGYAKTDAQYADKVIIITNNIVPYPNVPFGIPECDVDYVVKIDEVGDINGIVSGATRYTTNPKELLIAKTATDVIEASRLFKNGFSFQMGSGGSSLAVARFLREKMIRQNIKADFALGGITGQIVKMHEEGLVKKILDVQSFDLIAAESLKNNRFHHQISASYYASPGNLGTAVNQLDIVVLSALEIDIEYNVNVLTGSDGIIRGAIGGHCDTAAGASVSIIVAPLVRGRIPTVVKAVTTVVTPGKTVDILVTDQGVSVNPQRKDLMRYLESFGIVLTPIEKLQEKAESIVGKPEPIKYTDKIIGIVTYRDGSVIDVIRQVED